MCTRPRFMYNSFGQVINSVPCKTCIECRNLRREEYTQRLQFEWQTHNYIGSFISLTYRDDDLPILLPEGSAIVGDYFGSVPPAYGSTLSRRDLSQFADKLGKRVRRKFGWSIKYILVGEYGDDGHRPHYHGIVLGLPVSEKKMIYDTWSKGRVDIDFISHADIRYTLEYIDKQVFGANYLYKAYGDFEPPFAHFSKGLGVEYFKQNIDKFDSFGKLTFDGGKTYTLNPYFRDKLGFSKKPWQPYTDSVIKYAKVHKISLDEAYLERQKTVEQSLRLKQVHKQILNYDVDKITLTNARERFFSLYGIYPEEIDFTKYGIT